MVVYETGSVDEAVKQINSLKQYINANMYCFSKKEYCSIISHLCAVDYSIVSNINECDD